MFITSILCNLFLFFFILVKINNIKLGILTILSAQFASVKYIHSGHKTTLQSCFPCKTETL